MDGVETYSGVGLACLHRLFLWIDWDFAFGFSVVSSSLDLSMRVLVSEDVGPDCLERRTHWG